MLCCAGSPRPPTPVLALPAPVLTRLPSASTTPSLPLCSTSPAHHCREHHEPCRLARQRQLGVCVTQLAALRADLQRLASQHLLHARFLCGFVSRAREAGGVGSGAGAHVAHAPARGHPRIPTPRGQVRAHSSGKCIARRGATGPRVLAAPAPGCGLRKSGCCVHVDGRSRRDQRRTAGRVGLALSACRQPVDGCARSLRLSTSPGRRH
jgi:hypothetical protein